MITINDIPITPPISFKVSIMDISNAERNANGDIMIDRIATKRKIEIEWSYLKNEEISTILSAVSTIFFNVTYPDPMAGIELTKTFYVGDREAPVQMFKNDIPIWAGLKFDLIER